jgi:hypothetical protein
LVFSQGHIVVVGCRGAKSPQDDQDNDGAHDSSDEASAFTGLIPAKRLTQIGGNERSSDAQQRGQDESRRLVRGSWVEELGNNSGNKSDNDEPEDLHTALQVLTTGEPRKYERAAAGRLAKPRGNT